MGTSDYRGFDGADGRSCAQFKKIEKTDGNFSYPDAR